MKATAILVRRILGESMCVVYMVRGKMSFVLRVTCVAVSQIAFFPGVKLRMGTI